MNNPRDGNYRARVTFRGIALDCEFNYIKAHDGDLSGPPEPELAEFTSVKHLGECIYSLLGEDGVSALADQCIERIKMEMEPS